LSSQRSSARRLDSAAIPSYTRGYSYLQNDPAACANCHVTRERFDRHDPETMQLRVARPGFLDGIRARKAAEGMLNYDPNTMATRQEMRAFVCGQCHVEYYFRGPEKRLAYRWAKGLRVDQIADFYDGAGFADWTHVSNSGCCAFSAGAPLSAKDARRLQRRGQFYVDFVESENSNWLPCAGGSGARPCRGPRPFQAGTGVTEAAAVDSLKRSHAPVR
jgi:hypothetical protein